MQPSGGTLSIVAVDIGSFEHDIVLQNPSGAPTPIDDGGFTQEYADLVPLWWASITPASARDLERHVSSTIAAQASHLVRMQYLAGVTTQTRVLLPAPTFQSRPDDDDWTGQILQVTGVENPKLQGVELVLACVESVQ